MRWCVLLLVSACGVPQTEFEASFQSRYCELNNACIEVGGGDPGECPEAPVADDTCAYDPAAARVCLSELEEAACEPLLHILLPPATCACVCSSCEGTDSGQR